MFFYPSGFQTAFSEDAQSRALKAPRWSAMPFRLAPWTFDIATRPVRHLFQSVNLKRLSTRTQIQTHNERHRQPE
jgi:hypothetical protein